MQEHEAFADGPRELCSSDEHKSSYIFHLFYKTLMTVAPAQLVDVEAGVEDRVHEHEDLGVVGEDAHVALPRQGGVEFAHQRVLSSQEECETFNHSLMLTKRECHQYLEKHPRVVVNVPVDETCAGHCAADAQCEAVSEATRPRTLKSSWRRRRPRRLRRLAVETSLQRRPQPRKESLQMLKCAWDENYICEIGVLRQGGGNNCVQIGLDRPEELLVLLQFANLQKQQLFIKREQRHEL